MTDEIGRETTDGVLALTLRRPAKRNALTIAMYEALIAGLADASADAAVRAVLVAGEGDDFCAGNDIADFIAQSSDAAFRFIRTMAGFDKPIVAAVQGAAVGVGATMLLHCDLVYAAPDARLSTPFASLGLVPEAGSSLLLPRRIGEAKAAAMLLLGDTIDAAAAERAGLVTAIVDGDLVGHARAKAIALTRMPPRALARTRALMRGDRSALDARIEAEAAAFREALGGAEAREAFAAFAEKRAPDFSHL